MLYAALVFAAAVLLGAVLRCLVPRPKGRDLYISGRPVELVYLRDFMAELPCTRHVLQRVVLKVVKRPDGTREVIETYESPWKLAGVGPIEHVYLQIMLDGLLLRRITK